MPDWPTVEFCELAAAAPSSFSVGPFGSSVTTGDYVPEGVPFIRGVNLARGVFHDDDFVYIKEETADRLRSATVGPGDLVFTRKGTVGQVAMLPKKSRYSRYVISSSQMKAQLDPAAAAPEFFYYWFRSPQGRQSLLANVSTVGVPSIANSLATLKGIRVPRPPIHEQRSVANLLAALDAKIGVGDRIVETSRELGRAEFAAAVRGTAAEEHELAEMVENLTRGVTPRYTADGSGLTVLNQRCVRGGRVSLGPSRTTDPGGVPSGKRLRLNDVLVNSTGVGTLGRVARWALDTPATVDSHVTIVRFDLAKTDVLCAAFSMLAAQPEIEAMGEGSTGQTELSRAKLGCMRILLPSLEKCRQIRPRLEVLETRGDAALAESAKLAELRDALLPKLMSRKIRVRDAEKMVEDVT